MMEVNILARCDCQFVVRHYNSWIENDCLFIQMELCSDNLRNIIDRKPQSFDRESNQEMNAIEYHFSSQLFQEVLECVQYLHESKPAIIHRDLKPENILIAGPQNGKFLKLCDFGLATFGDTVTRTHTKNQGTQKYMAPEVIAGMKYSNKADIYSIAISSIDLFDFYTNV